MSRTRSIGADRRLDEISAELAQERGALGARRPDAEASKG